MSITDKFQAEALARTAAIEDAANEKFVGALVSIDIDEEERLATYLFEAALPWLCRMALGRYCN